MPRFNFAGHKQYGVGLHQLGPYILTNKIKRFRLSITRDLLPDAGVELFRLRSWLSYDAGETWSEGAGFGTYGGDQYDPDNNLITESWIEWNLEPQKHGKPARRIKLELDVFVAIEFEGIASWQ